MQTLDKNQYDIIIIGGGIAGLYKAYQTLKTNPHSKILLLEAQNRLGGRIHTYNDKIYTRGIEAGAGRFHKSHRRLITLLKELGLDHLAVPISNKKQYIPTPTTQLPTTPPDQLLNIVLKEADKTPPKTLQNQTFIKYAAKVLPNKQQQAQQILDSFGYSTELTEMNAYDTITLIKQHYINHQFYALKGGMEQIITKLTTHLNTYHNFEFHLKEPAINIQPINQTPSSPIQIQTSKQTYTTNVCICALLKEDLQKIHLFKPIKPLLQPIQNFPLCRIYCKFPIDPKTNQVWFQDLPKLTTNNHLRYIIPINAQSGTIMISYTDNKYADYWYHKYKTQGIQKVNQDLQTKLQQIFPNHKIPKPTHTKVFYWKHGVAYFKPGFDSIKDIPKIRHPFPSNPNIQICGENYSTKNIQWIEGALE